jgi:SAM-dependent methyltransferase
MAHARLTSPRLEAELYALTHRGTAGDAAFYVRTCSDADRVLELGSGYGRLIAKLARPGRLVTGLEVDAALLSLARRELRLLPLAARRAVRLTQGDMRHFALGQRVSHVLLPYNGLYCLLSKRDALACFRSVRAALAVGGVFVFDVWNAEGFQHQKGARSSLVETEPIVTLDHGGRTWNVFERSRRGRIERRLDVAYRYVPTTGTPLELTIRQRYFRASELGELLDRAGFVVEKRYGSFSGSRFTDRDRARSVTLAAGRRARIGASGELPRTMPRLTPDMVRSISRRRNGNWQPSPMAKLRSGPSTRRSD